MSSLINSCRNRILVDKSPLRRLRSHCLAVYLCQPGCCIAVQVCLRSLSQSLSILLTSGTQLLRFFHGIGRKFPFETYWTVKEEADTTEGHKRRRQSNREN